MSDHYGSEPFPPPDIPLYDLTEDDERALRAYLDELQQRMLDWELDPRNFFRLAKPGQMSRL